MFVHLAKFHEVFLYAWVADPVPVLFTSWCILFQCTTSASNDQILLSFFFFLPYGASLAPGVCFATQLVGVIITEN